MWFLRARKRILLDMNTNMNMTSIEQITTWLLAERDPAFAQWSEDYLRGQFPFFGVRTPQIKQQMKGTRLPVNSDLHNLVRELWALPEREYQKVALELLLNVKKKLTMDELPLLEHLICTKSWWDTVDTIAPHLVSELAKRNPREMTVVLERWIISNNFWLRRAAILYPLHWRTATDVERLLRYCRMNAVSDEFFIQKAIGWALREYAKTDATAVQHFVATNTLKPLSVREALKHVGRRNQ